VGRVLMLFLDGVGIGVRDPSVNPLFAARLPALRSILGGDLPSLRRRSITSGSGTVLPLDATLGVPGLPQSGTGQTSLFTGVNGAALAGKHFGPYPYSTLKPVIAARSIFRRLRDAGKSPLFANAFPRRFFDYVEAHKGRLSVTTLSCAAAGVPLLRAGDLFRGKAVSADITNAGWHDLGYAEIPVIAPEEAGERLAHLARDHDFVLFEYWKTDKAGHAMSAAESINVLETLDAMLAGILRAFNAARTLLLITSDHGNIEDLTVKTHTRHPVPLVLAGAGWAQLAGRFPRDADLTAVCPALLDYIGIAT
jgi:2,3-bisphosphoglycerate-independent phosphoglycerate mutase